MTCALDTIIDAALAHDEPAEQDLGRVASQRILVLDGAMGTQIQGLGLDETHFRGDRFQCCERHLQGNNDLLTLTQPRAIEEIHFAYALAGADILRDQHLLLDLDRAGRLRHSGHRLRAQSRRGAIGAARRDQGGKGRRQAPLRRRRPGPTNRTASLSPDVNNPGFRAVTFDELRVAYREQIRGLIDGGADLILIETIFDTLNAKAAIFACFETFAERGVRLPMMISGTITDRSGRTLSGQNSRPPSGIRCATRAPFPSASIARSERAPCASIWPRSRRRRTRSSAPIPTPACPTHRPI